MVARNNINGSLPDIFYKGAMRRGRLREGVMGRERQGWVNGEVWRVDMKERGREGEEATERGRWGGGDRERETGRGRGRGVMGMGATGRGRWRGLQWGS